MVSKHNFVAVLNQTQCLSVCSTDIIGFQLNLLMKVLTKVTFFELFAFIISKCELNANKKVFFSGRLGFLITNYGVLYHPTGVCKMDVAKLKQNWTKNKTND